MVQHASLTLERWATFSVDQQVLMIANEMHRASKLQEPDDSQRLQNSYERILNLTDLTIAAQSRDGFRREMLRWRDLVASLYLQPEPAQHLAALRVLLLFTPEAAKQRPYIAPG